MTSYPQTTPDGRTIWACCASEIGPACQHRKAAIAAVQSICESWREGATDIARHYASAPFGTEAAEHSAGRAIREYTERTLSGMNWDDVGRAFLAPLYAEEGVNR